MRIVHCIIALIVLLASLAEGAVSPGLSAGVSLQSINVFANSVIPLALKAVKEFDIPDFSGKKGIIKFSASNIRFNSLNVGSFVSEVVANKIRVGLTDVNANIALKWKYSSKTKFPFGSGTATAKLASHRCTIDLVVNNVVNANNQPRPQVKVVGTDINLDKLKIDVHGSLLSWIYTAISSMLSGTIRKTVQNAVASTLVTSIDQISATILTSLPMSAPIGSWGILSYALTSSMQYSGSTAYLGFDFGTHRPNHPVDTVTPRNNIPFVSSGRMFEGFMDVFVFNSAFRALHQSGAFAMQFEEHDRPASFPFQLNTSSWTLLPELHAYYPFAPMRITVSLPNQPSLKTVPDLATFATDVGIGIHVFAQNQWLSVYELLIMINGSASFSIEMEQNLPMFHVRIGTVETKFQVKSSIRQPDTQGLVKILNPIVNKFIIPLLNIAMFSGYQIPSVNGISLTNASFKILQNGVYFGTDLSFNIGSHLSALDF